MRLDCATATAAGQRVGVLTFDEAVPLQPAAVVRSLGPRASLAAAATRLYSCLRELDAAGVDLILAHGVAETAGLAAALQDRLRRAAAGRVLTC